MIKFIIFFSLSSPNDRVVFYAITTLHNLLVHVEESRPAVRNAGGIQPMCQLLQRTDEKFLALDVDCLHWLALQHQETRV